jgi:hypothetical protein
MLVRYQAALMPAEARTITGRGDVSTAATRSFSVQQIAQGLELAQDLDERRP